MKVRLHSLVRERDRRWMGTLAFEQPDVTRRRPFRQWTETYYSRDGRKWTAGDGSVLGSVLDWRRGARRWRRELRRALRVKQAGLSRL